MTPPEVGPDVPYTFGLIGNYSSSMNSMEIANDE